LTASKPELELEPEPGFVAGQDEVERHLLQCQTRRGSYASFPPPVDWWHSRWYDLLHALHSTMSIESAFLLRNKKTTLTFTNHLKL
jgi:hypothetical protein